MIKLKKSIYLKTDKGKWFASDANNKAFNSTGIMFTLNKKRAHNFAYKSNAEWWARKLEDDGIKVTIVEEEEKI